jgi:hypothetical protein
VREEEVGEVEEEEEESGEEEPLLEYDVESSSVFRFFPRSLFVDPFVAVNEEVTDVVIEADPRVAFFSDFTSTVVVTVSSTVGGRSNCYTTLN